MSIQRATTEAFQNMPEALGRARNANMQCNTATSREPSYQGFALNTQNNAVLCSDDGTEYFIGLCDGTGSNSGTYGGGGLMLFRYNTTRQTIFLGERRYR